MKCYKCGKDRNFFGELVLTSITDEPESPKRDICIYCLGWKKEPTNENTTEIFCPVCDENHLYDTRHWKSIENKMKPNTSATMFVMCPVTKKKFEFKLQKS